jgi:hypothetical protein
MLVSPSASIGILPHKTQRCRTGVYYICSTSQKILGVMPVLVNKAFYGNGLGFLAFAALA